MPKYCFTGHEAIGAHIARCLEPLGWKRAFDAADAHIAFSYCTTLTALEDAYFDDDGFVRRAKPGTLLVDLSPSTPALARELSAVATVNDLRPVEAPISVVDPTRPDAFAKAANVMCFAAGEEQDVEEAIDVLETIAGRVERTGAPGTAQLAKAARTVQMAALTAGAAEADALVRATHDATALLDSYAASVRPACEEMTGLLASVANDQFAGAYTVEMLMGEVAAAMGAAEDANLILPQLEAIMHLLEVTAVIGGADKSPATLSLIYRDEAASAANGLDWTRAEDLFGEGDCDCGHDHDHEHDDYDDGYGFFGGIGGYSAN